MKMFWQEAADILRKCRERESERVSAYSLAHEEEYAWNQGSYWRDVALCGSGRRSRSSRSYP